MARQTREEWLRTLMVGDKASCTFDGDELPSVGTVESCSGTTVLVKFQHKPFLVHFEDGRLLGDPNVLLWMVATGSGGSVGLPIRVSNLQARLDGKDSDAG